MSGSDQSSFSPETQRHLVHTPEGTIYLEEAAALPMPDPADVEERQNRVLHLARAYLLMCGGLAISALFSLVFAAGEVAHDPVAIGVRIAWNQLLLIAEIALVPFIANKVPRIPPGVASALFVSYAILNGLTFPGLFFWMPPQDVARVFAAAAVAYGMLGWLYRTRKAEILGFAALVSWTVIALVSALLFSIGASPLTRNSCLAIVPVFLALAAYYDREVAEPYQSFEDDDTGWKDPCREPSSSISLS